MFGILFAIMSLIIPPPTAVVTPNSIAEVGFRLWFRAFVVPVMQKMPSPIASQIVIMFW